MKIWTSICSHLKKENFGPPSSSCKSRIPNSAMSLSQDSSFNNTSSSSSSPTSRFFRRILNFKKKRDQYEQPQPSLTGIPKLGQQLARIVDAIKVPKVFSNKWESAAAAAAAPPPRGKASTSNSSCQCQEAMQKLTGMEEDQEMLEILELASWAC